MEIFFKNTKHLIRQEETVEQEEKQERWHETNDNEQIRHSGYWSKNTKANKTSQGCCELEGYYLNGNKHVPL